MVEFALVHLVLSRHPRLHLEVFRQVLLAYTVWLESCKTSRINSASWRKAVGARLNRVPELSAPKEGNAARSESIEVPYLDSHNTSMDLNQSKGW